MIKPFKKIIKLNGVRNLKFGCLVSKASCSIGFGLIVVLFILYFESSPKDFTDV